MCERHLCIRVSLSLFLSISLSPSLHVQAARQISAAQAAGIDIRTLKVRARRDSDIDSEND